MKDLAGLRVHVARDCGAGVPTKSAKIYPAVGRTRETISVG